MRRIIFEIGAALGIAMLLGGCATATGGGIVASGAPKADTAVQASAPPDESWECRGHAIEPGAYANAPAADELTGELAAAVAGADNMGIPLALERPEQWSVIDLRPTEILLLQPLGPQAGPDGDHSMIVLAPAADGAAWELTAWTNCMLGPDPAPLERAGLTLDPDHLPDPAATELHVLVTEHACNSGRNAEGRVELISLTETTDEIVLRVGVKPHGGLAECLSSLPTPFTITLDDPIGDRRILDGAFAFAPEVQAPAP